MMLIEKILKDLDIPYRAGGTENFVISCINPEHNDHKPSMYIHKELGILHCFSCGHKGNVFTLLGKFGIGGVDAYKYLLRFSEGEQSEDSIKKALDAFIKERGNKQTQEDKGVEYLNVILPQHRILEELHPYLEERGLSLKEVKEWNMAVVTAGKQLGWILIPLYQNGTIRNYFLRSTFGKGKLYGEYPRNDILAGLDLATDTDKPLYVTEGIFDAIAVRRAKKQAVATLSNRLLPAQLTKLKKFKKIVFVPDNDENNQGVSLVQGAGQLIYTNDVKVILLPNGRKDAAECTLPEIIQATYKELNWNEYIINKRFFIKSS